MTRATRARRRRAWPIVAVAASFFAGMLFDAWLRTHGPPMPAGEESSARSQPVVAAAAPHPPVSDSIARRDDAAIGNGATATMGSSPRSSLRVPIEGVDIESWKGGFDERRDAGRRGHEAVDIPSPRNTPVHAVDSGTIAKIFESKQGGHTIYQFSADRRLAYYYAHLERYADGLHEGQTIERGEIIGFVGTSGNAPPNTPHLHFAIFELGRDQHWWQGRALDPYLVFKSRG